ncbi:MAG: AbgT family transporter [Gammaproteobacteria bacterium]|nr:AbgT family transporter [Gammaproteobacteria bacterium]
MSSLLDKLERVGNRLPDPSILFIAGSLLIVLLAEIAVIFQWQAVRWLGPEQSELVMAQSVLQAEGIWWWLSSMVQNFIQFPPLGIVLVGMLGIGLAERCGLLPALICAAGHAIQDKYLIPATLFIGVMSSLAMDAGYVVLPPLAATLFMAAGRSPILGIVTSFAGVSAGFGANLFITSIDPLLAGFTQSAAQIITPDYQVAVTSNWWFMAVSTIVLTFSGWAITHYWVAPRTERLSFDAQSAEPLLKLNTTQRSALRWAAAAFVVVLAVALLATWHPAGALHGSGKHFPRWVEATVPLLFLLFLIPGVVYGLRAGSIRSSKDAAGFMGSTLADLGPYIVLAFFAAQFIAIFKYTHLGEMLALSGGAWLAAMEMNVFVLLCAFVLLVCFGNLLIGSMSAKYAFYAPVFVPMLMQAGVSPELTQLVYRIGDSVTNVITPFNPYMIIILALLQKYHRQAGVGTLISLTLPYSVGFLLTWMLLLLFWLLLGLPLGPSA